MLHVLFIAVWLAENLPKVIVFWVRWLSKIHIIVPLLYKKKPFKATYLEDEHNRKIIQEISTKSRYGQMSTSKFPWIFNSTSKACSLVILMQVFSQTSFVIFFVVFCSSFRIGDQSPERQLREAKLRNQVCCRSEISRSTSSSWGRTRSP